MSEMCIAQRDQAAAADFYREDFTKLIRFAMSLGAQRSEAEDLAQEAMRSLLEALTRGSIQNAPAYVRTAARRTYLRKRTVAADRFQDMPEHTELTDRRDDVDAVCETTCPYEVRRVRHLLAALPREQREVMAWTVDGYKPIEIAQMTGQKPATVRSHLRHARNTLQMALEQALVTTGKEAIDGT